jgi:hypothetical protein
LAVAAWLPSPVNTIEGVETLELRYANGDPLRTLIH